MALAGTGVVIEVSDNDVNYAEIDGIKSFTFGPNREMLDVTDFKDGTFRKRLPGLFDYPVSLEGDYEPSDTNGQNVLRTAFFNGTTVFIRIKYDGTNGDKVECYVASYEASSGVEDLVSFSVELESTGARAAVS